MPLVKNLDAGIGWKKLAKTLQTVEKVLNANYPVRGHGITINETETGSIIAHDPKTDDDQQQNNNNGIVGPCSLRLYDVSFMGATIVDPTTCAQTFVQVLIQDPGGWIDINADIELPGVAHPDSFSG